eukprot:TRINITY_DN13826_c0_g1_i6.p1 TRINITY_DN13826_c0_g1~~TRINITY_DN13826_c0_g1_i6.p1  ORF type:complete len:118 (+),score=52.91 TRINITY_DN13826_c0_g1_i6:77-430(+)
MCIRDRFHIYDQQLKIKDYKGELNRYSQELCSNVMGKGQDLGICVREVKPVVDCIVRSKTSKLGTMMDNVGLCGAEISLMKRKMVKKYGLEVVEEREVFDKLDAAWSDLNYQMKAFV